MCLSQQGGNGEVRKVEWGIGKAAGHFVAPRGPGEAESFLGQTLRRGRSKKDSSIGGWVPWRWILVAGKLLSGLQ